MGREHQTHFVVANVDVGMVFLVFGHLGHGVHEIDGVGKVVELERPLDVLLLQLPLGDLFHSLFQLGGFDQVSHNGTTSNTRKLFCNDESSLFFRTVNSPKDREFSLNSSPNRKSPWRIGETTSIGSANRPAPSPL